MTNTVDLRMTNLEKVINLVADEVLEEDIFFVIDGSLISGQIDLSSLARRNPRVKILYYDSCSKYLQLGLDIAMGGLVVIPSEFNPVFERLRRNTGTIMYDSVANIFPIYPRDIHQKRMRRFTENAIVIGEMILKNENLKNQVTPHFPLLPNHPDRSTAIKFDSIGGIITFSFTNPYLNQRDSLNSFIEMALMVAKEHQVSLTKGVSFGFSIPRISAASAIAENLPPFLRLSVGDRSFEETLLLGRALIKTFEKYLQTAQRFYE